VHDTGFQARLALVFHDDLTALTLQVVERQPVHRRVVREPQQEALTGWRTEAESLLLDVSEVTARNVSRAH